MDIYEQNLHIEDETFEDMRASANAVLQRMIKDMIEKKASEGKMTITLGVELTENFLANVIQDPNAEDRHVYSPKFKYKVGSVMQIKNDLDGKRDFDGMELVFDEETGEYVMRPITGEAQMSIFDAEFREVPSEEVIEEVEQLEGAKVIGIPVIDEGRPGEYEYDDPEEPEDISDELF